MGNRSPQFNWNGIFRQKPDYNKSDYISAGCDSAKDQQIFRRTAGADKKERGSIYTGVGV